MTIKRRYSTADVVGGGCRGIDRRRTRRRWPNNPAPIPAPTAPCARHLEMCRSSTRRPRCSTPRSIPYFGGYALLFHHGGHGGHR